MKQKMKLVTILLALCLLAACTSDLHSSQAKQPDPGLDTSPNQTEEDLDSVEDHVLPPEEETETPAVILSENLVYYAAEQEDNPPISGVTDLEATVDGCMAYGQYYQGGTTAGAVLCYNQTGLQDALVLPMEENGFLEAVALAEDAAYYLEYRRAADAPSRVLHLGEIEVDITDQLPAETSVYSLQVDEEQIFLVSDTAVHFWDLEGTYLKGTPTLSQVTGTLFDKEGRLLLISQTAAGISLYSLDRSTGEMALEYTLPEEFSRYTLFSGYHSDYDCLLTDSRYLYGWNLDGDVMERLTDFTYLGLNPQVFSGLAFLTPDQFYISDWVSGVAGDRIMCLTESYQRETQDTIILGCITMPSAISAAVADYNLTNPAHPIECRDYQELYGTEAETFLKMDIAAGKGPDLLCLNGLSYSSYAARGLLVDLNEFLEEDATFNRETLLTGPLQALSEQNGSLYRLPQSVSINTVLGRSTVVGNQEAWTLPDMYAVLEAHPEISAVLYSQDPESVLTELLFQGYQQFVDYETKTASFDSQEFLELLEFTKTLEPYEGFQGEDALSCFVGGETLMMPLLVTDYPALQSVWEAMQGEVTCMGYPGANGSSFYVNHPMSIMAYSDYASEAWEFLKLFCTTDRYRDRGGWLLTKDALALREEQAIQSDISQGVIAQIQQLLEKTRNASNYDTDLMTIVQDETSGYFQDQFSAEETANKIQNRVLLYLAEMA